VVNLKICENCGTTNGNDDKNCKKCGHPLLSGANQFATTVVRRPIANRPVSNAAQPPQPVSNAVQPPRPQFANTQSNNQSLPQNIKPIPQQQPISQQKKSSSGNVAIPQNKIVNKSTSSQSNVKEKPKPQTGQQTKEMQKPAKPNVQAKPPQSQQSSQQITFSSIDEGEAEDETQYFNPDDIDQENLEPIPNKVNLNSLRNMQKPVGLKSNDPDFPLKPIAPSNDPINFIVPHPSSKIGGFFNRNKSDTEKSESNQTKPQKNSKQNVVEEETFNPNQNQQYGNQNQGQQRTNANMNQQNTQQQYPERQYSRQESPQQNMGTQSNNSQYAYQSRSQDMNQYQSNQQNNRTRSVDHDKFEMAMTDALMTLKTKFGSSFSKASKAKKTFDESEPVVQKPQISVPESLNDILISLEELDLNIEASALVDIEGNILVSATSKRISESLIATIAQTLGNISQDMIDALDSGSLSFIALHATKGILFLSPVLKRVFLLLLTGPEAKSGVINIARLKVKKQMDLFYAKKNLSKSPI
jgi:predicted regulator of Ras-like GTPase activity (Roadblock/LC7/MglB family)